MSIQVEHGSDDSNGTNRPTIVSAGKIQIWHWSRWGASGGLTWQNGQTARLPLIFTGFPLTPRYCVLLFNKSMSCFHSLQVNDGKNIGRNWHVRLFICRKQAKDINNNADSEKCNWNACWCWTPTRFAKIKKASWQQEVECNISERFILALHSFPWSKSLMGYNSKFLGISGPDGHRHTRTSRIHASKFFHGSHIPISSSPSSIIH